MTEGYLWTEQYPEAQRVLTKGNGQSMELDENRVKGQWSDESNGQPSFFIINEAIIKKLCILGDEVEPCFEGASITEPTIQFSFDPGFKAELFSMFTELKELLGKGGEQVELDKNVELIEDEKIQDENDKLNPSEIQEVEEEKVETEMPEKAEDPQEPEADPVPPVEEEKEPEVVEPETEEEPVDDPQPEAQEEPAKYSLDEIPEYIQLMNAYTKLENSYNELVNRANELEETVNALTEFKKGIELAEKQEMINKFFMLSDEDKKDVVDNIDKYSVDQIEAKLSVICFRKRINLTDNTEETEEDPITSFSLEQEEEDDVPDWVKAVRATQKSMN